MSGTKSGARKAKQTIINKYGEDHWAKIGVKGQQAYLAQPKHLRPPRGFAVMPLEKVRQAGIKGGRKSRK